MKSEMSELTKKLVPVVRPLMRKEEQAAIKAAKAHVAKDLSDHYRVLGAELRIDKPSDGGKIQRTLGVLILDYGNRRNFEVLVDAVGKVVRIVDLLGAQPAYTSDEIKEARGIAEQDSRVARIAKTNGAFVSEFGPERTSDNARRIGLRYAVVERQIPRVLAHAIVDMSARKLVHVEESRGESQ